MTGHHTLQPDPLAMSTHLHWMFDWARETYSEALIEIAHGQEKPNSARLFKPAEIAEAVTFAEGVNMRGHNVYVGAALRKPETNRSKRASNADCLATRVIVVDADEHTALVAEKIKTIAIPGLIVMTGTTPELRQQFWIKLTKECTSVDLFAQATKVLVSHVGADENAIGAARIMRLGGSVSYPTEKKIDRGYIAEVTTLACNHEADPVDIAEILGLRTNLQDLAPDIPMPLPIRKERLSDEARSGFGKASHAHIADLLRQIRNDDCLWSKWFEIGAATHYAAGGSHAGEDLWQKWSARSHKHDAVETARTWRSFDQTNENPNTLGTLIYYARKDSTPRAYPELKEAIKAIDPDNCDMDVLDQLLREIAELKPTKRDELMFLIKSHTKIPLRTLRDQIKAETETAEPDHLELAKLTVERIKSENIICVDAIFWKWIPTGVWRETNDRFIGSIIHDVIRDNGLEVTASLVNSVTDVMKTVIFREGHRFNLGNPETVNCLNCELELIDGVWQQMPHRRENYRTTQIPVAYDVAAEAPRFIQFLDEVFRDDADKDEKKRSMLELAGYTLMSHARHEKFVLAIGPGANGKSVFLEVLSALCGPDNVAGVQPGNFDRTFQRAHLNQKLANIITELRQGEVVADAELKSITSGEPSTVEHKFGHPFVMRPFSTCWFGTNHMPHTRDFSNALFRRAVILTFNRTFAKHEQDPLLKEELKAELPGILNLALRAYARALKEGFTDPTSSFAAKKDWRLEADQVAQFLEDSCEQDEQWSERSNELFVAYKEWAVAQGISRTLTHRSFRQRLTALGFGQGRDKYGKIVTGLRLKSIR